MKILYWTILLCLMATNTQAQLLVQSRRTSGEAFVLVETTHDSITTVSRGGGLYDEAMGITITSTTNGYLMVFIKAPSGFNVDSLKLDSGQKFSLIDTTGVNSSTFYLLWAFGLKTAAAGNDSLRLWGTGVGEYFLVARNWSGVHQTTPIGTVVKAETSFGNHLDLTPTLAAADSGIAIAHLNHVSRTITTAFPNNEALNISYDGGADYATDMRQFTIGWASGTGAIDMDFDAVGGSAQFEGMAFALKPAD